jgi:hypothetical protein
MFAFPVGFDPIGAALLAPFAILARVHGISRIESGLGRLRNLSVLISERHTWSRAFFAPTIILLIPRRTRVTLHRPAAQKALPTLFCSQAGHCVMRTILRRERRRRMVHRTQKRNLRNEFFSTIRPSLKR